MYTVKVFSNGEAIDERDFEYGTFQNIGYWLDYAGFINPAYKVIITFSE